MELKLNIDSVIFDEFVRSRVSHYGQLSSFGEIKKFQEKYNYTLCGLYENDELVGTFVLLTKRFLYIKFAYIPYGPCMDYSEYNINEFTRLLKDYGNKNHIDFFRVDPFVEVSHPEVTEYMKNAGFKHRGYTYGYVGSFTNRHTLIIDIEPSYEEIFKNFTGSRRRKINRQKDNVISYRLADKEEVSVMCYLENFLAVEKGFKPHSEEFFKKYMDLYKDNYVYLIVSIDIDETINNTNKKLKEADEEKTVARLNKELNNLNELKNKYGSKADIACCLFLYLNDYCWDLYSYKNSDFDFLPTIDFIHVYTIQEMKKRNVKKYDMVGFSGFTNKDDPYYGLYEYKTSFGSKIVEYIGQFDLEIKKGSAAKFHRYYTDIYRTAIRKFNSIKSKLKNHEKR